jgi:arylsulfatase A-like enzyme
VNGNLKSVRGYATRVMTRFSLRFIRHFESKDDAAQWLLYVAPHAPHQPWIPEKRYADAPVPPVGRGIQPCSSGTGPTTSVFQPDPLLTRRPEGERNQLRTLMSVDDMCRPDLSDAAQARRAQEHPRVLPLRQRLPLGRSSPRRRPEHRRAEAASVHPVRSNSLLRPLAGASAFRGRDPRLTGNRGHRADSLEAAGHPPGSREASARRPLAPRPERPRPDPLEYWLGHASPWIPTWASIRTPEYQYVEYYAEDKKTVVFREYYDLVEDPWQLENLLADGNPANDPDVPALSAPARRRPGV